MAKVTHFHRGQSLLCQDNYNYLMNQARHKRDCPLKKIK
jgi:hypothetical protein